jgi:phosphoglycolate phosphatase-like HAD superfamily hydrolase
MAIKSTLSLPNPVGNGNFRLVTMRRILLFDIDMTMIRTDGAGRGAMEEAFKTEFGVGSATEGIRFDGRTDRGIFLECLERHGFGGDDLLPNFHRFSERYLELFPEWIARKGGVVLPGVTDLLDALEETDAIVGLATGNLRRGAALKLGHFGLWERFEGGGFGDNSAVRADLVRAGITELEAKFGLASGTSEVIVLGDTPLDVEAAHLAGAKALGVGTGRFTPEELLASDAEFAMADLSDTARALEILVG